MSAALHYYDAAPGFTRLLEHCEHCAAVKHVPGDKPASPCVRVEDALGGELARRLIDALAHGAGMPQRS